MLKSNSTYPQLSDWSTAQDSVSHNRFTLNIVTQNNTRSNNIQFFDHVINDDLTNNDKQKSRSFLRFCRCCSSIPISIRGLFLGLLFGSLILTVIIPLWLASTNKATITTTTTGNLLNYKKIQ